MQLSDSEKAQLVEWINSDAPLSPALLHALFAASTTELSRGLVKPPIFGLLTIALSDLSLTWHNEECAAILGYPDQTTFHAVSNVLELVPDPQQRQVVEQFLAGTATELDRILYMTHQQDQLVRIRIRARKYADRGVCEVVIVPLPPDAHGWSQEDVQVKQVLGIIQAAPFGAHSYELLADGNLKFTYANPAAERILQLEHAPLIGRNILDAWPGLTGTGIPEAYAHVARTGQPWTDEQVHYADGKLTGAFEVSAYQSGDRQVTALFRDITERKRAELEATEARRQLEITNELLSQVNSELTATNEELSATLEELEQVNEELSASNAELEEAQQQLLESVRFNATMFDVSSIGMAAFAANHNCVMVNTLYSELFSTTRDQLLATPLSQQPLWHHGELKSAAESTLKSGERSYLQVSFSSANGDQLWLDCYMTGFTIFGERHLLVSIIDVTSQLAAAQALRESEERYRTMFENLAQGVVYQGADGTITSANPAALRILGLTMDQIQGRTSLDPRWQSIREDKSVFPGEEHPVSQTLATGQPVHDVMMGIINPANESRRWILINAIPCFRAGESKPFEVFSSFSDITWRIEAEEALRESEFWLQESQRVSHIGSYVMDIQAGTWVSTIALDEIFGIDADFPRNVDGWSRILHPDYRDDLLAYLLEEVFGKRQTFDRTYRIIRISDGAQRCVHGRGKLFFNDRGEPVKMAGTIQDITDRMNAEMQLRESEERYRVLFEAESDAIIVIDPETFRILDVNPAAEELYLYPRSELLQLTADQLSNEPEQTRHRIGTSDGLEHVILRYHKKKDGTVFPVEITGRTFDYRGSKALLVAIRDITLRIEAESQIRESEARYRLLFESNPQPAWVYDIDSLRFLAVNEAAIDHYGYSRDEFLSMTIRDIRPPEEIPVMLDMVAEAGGNRAIPGIWRHFKRDGSEIQIESFGHALQFEGCNAELILINDITDRLKLESRRRQLEEQLRQAQKLEALGTLAGGIAHDFNNILFGILGYAELLGDSIAEGTLEHEYISAIRTGGHRAAELVKQILTFARRSPHRRTDINIVPIVKETLKLLRSTLPANIEIVQHISVVSATITADPTEIHQVLMNLCTNASQAMLDREGKLTVALHIVSPSTDWSEGCTGESCYILEVQDTGAGIEPEILGSIFDPFFTTKAVGEGTGMGLAVVHSIVQELHGSIEVHSAVGGGTLFRIRIPASVKLAIPAESADTAVPRGVERVMVVDDEPAIVKIVSQILCDLGYAVDSFQDSPAALEAFMDNPRHFDAAILDQAMPRMTGVEVAEQILAVRPDFPIIICTGHSQTLTPEKCTAMGVARLLHKPLTKLELAQALRHALDLTAQPR